MIESMSTSTLSAMAEAEDVKSEGERERSSYWREEARQRSDSQGQLVKFIQLGQKRISTAALLVAQSQQPIHLCSLQGETQRGEILCMLSSSCPSRAGLEPAAPRAPPAGALSPWHPAPSPQRALAQVALVRCCFNLVQEDAASRLGLGP